MIPPKPVGPHPDAESLYRAHAAPKAAASAEVLAHAATCAACSQELAALESFDARTRRTRSAEPPAAPSRPGGPSPAVPRRAERACRCPPSRSPRRSSSSRRGRAPRPPARRGRRTRRRCPRHRLPDRRARGAARGIPVPGHGRRERPRERLRRGPFLRLDEPRGGSGTPRAVPGAGAGEAQAGRRLHVGRPRRGPHAARADVRDPRGREPLIRSAGSGRGEERTADCAVTRLISPREERQRRRSCGLRRSPGSGPPCSYPARARRRRCNCR